MAAPKWATFDRSRPEPRFACRGFAIATQTRASRSVIPDQTPIDRLGLAEDFGTASANGPWSVPTRGPDERAASAPPEGLADASLEDLLSRVRTQVGVTDRSASTDRN